MGRNGVSSYRVLSRVTSRVLEPFSTGLKCQDQVESGVDHTRVVGGFSTEMRKELLAFAGSAMGAARPRTMDPSRREPREDPSALFCRRWPGRRLTLSLRPISALICLICGRFSISIGRQ